MITLDYETGQLTNTCTCAHSLGQLLLALAPFPWKLVRCGLGHPLLNRIRSQEKSIAIPSGQPGMVSQSHGIYCQDGQSLIKSGPSSPLSIVQLTCFPMQALTSFVTLPSLWGCKLLLHPHCI